MALPVLALKALKGQKGQEIMNSVTGNNIRAVSKLRVLGLGFVAAIVAAIITIIFAATALTEMEGSVRSAIAWGTFVVTTTVFTWGLMTITAPGVNRIANKVNQSKRANTPQNRV